VPSVHPAIERSRPASRLRNYACHTIADGQYIREPDIWRARRGVDRSLGLVTARDVDPMAVLGQPVIESLSGVDPKESVVAVKSYYIMCCGDEKSGNPETGRLSLTSIRCIWASRRTSAQPPPVV